MDTFFTKWCWENWTDTCREIKPHLYGRLVFYTGSRNIHWGEDSLFGRWFWENWSDTYKKMKLPSYTTHKNKLKMD